MLHATSHRAPLIPGPRGQFMDRLSNIHLLLMHQEKIEELRSAPGAQEILAVRSRDEQLALHPSKRNPVDIDTIHRFILSPRPVRDTSSDFAMTFSIVPRLSSLTNAFSSLFWERCPKS
jgi:hypothetical protein